MELILRVIFSLLVVLGLMWFLARLARRPFKGRDTEAFSVIDRRQLSRSASVAVVRIAGKALVLGITEAQVTLLGEVDLAALRSPRADAERRSPVPLLEQVPSADRAGSADRSGSAEDGADVGFTDGDLAALLDGDLHGIGGLNTKGGNGRAHWNGSANGSASGNGSARENGNGGGRLAGSALSPHTWATAVEVLRARTVRKS